ncbi:MAG: glycosyltransferase family 4 protein [Alphaproteobacteria bacterium]
MSPATNTSSPSPSPLRQIRPLPSIDILLPAKERFTAANAGAISGVVNDLVAASQTGGCFRICGTMVDTPLNNHQFLGLRPRGKWFRGNNIGCAADYLAQIEKTGAPDLVEVHSRCHVATYIKQRHPDVRVSLYLHNDPRDMKGGKSVKERTSLLRNMASIICVSTYIRECFLDGLVVDDALAAKVGVARNGTQRWLASQPAKHPVILIAGRMVPEKGILECAQALAGILPDHPDWRLVIAGAKRFEAVARGSYEAQISKVIESLGEQAVMTGFIPIDEVREWQAKAAISACPSLWNDPMPKAVIESLAAGCALLTTRRGGIPEVADGRAHVVDTPSIAHFSAAFEKLLTDDAYRKSLQDAAWHDFPFTANAMADDADALRAQCLMAPN